MTKYNPNQNYWRVRVRRSAERALHRAENKLAQLDVRQQIDEIDKKLAKLKVYPSYKADDVQPCTLDIIPATSLQGEN